MSDHDERLVVSKNKLNMMKRRFVSRELAAIEERIDSLVILLSRCLSAESAKAMSELVQAYLKYNEVEKRENELEKEFTGYAAPEDVDLSFEEPENKE